MGNFSEEEIKLKLGYDASAVVRGTQSMMDQQKKSALDYVTFWKKSINEVEQAQISADVRAASRANQAAALNRQRAEQQAQRLAAINANIAQGSIPQNMQSGSAVRGRSGRGGSGATGGMVAAQVVDNIESGMSAHDVIHTAVIGTEIGVTGTIGAVATHFAMRMIAKVFAVAATAIGGSAAMLSGTVLAGLAIVAGPSAWRTYQARSAAAANEKDTEEKSRGIAEELRKRIEAMQKSGVLSESSARGALSELEKPTYESVSRVQIMTNALLSQQKSAEALVEHNRQLAADAARRAAWQEKYNRLLEQQNNLNREARALRKQERGAEHSIADIDVEKLTIAQLAGRQAVAAIAAQFGEGGQFDIESGTGPFAKAAADALFYKGKQGFDISQGNARWRQTANGPELVGGAAFEDRRRQMAAENTLWQAGLETPAMQQKAMLENLTDIKTNIANLWARANADGLKIAVPDDD